VRDYDSVEASVAAAATELGGLDHVICSAGVMRVGPSVATAPAALAEVIDVNVKGTLNVARAAHLYLRERAGSFTVFASSSFTLGRPNYVAYSGSKAAVANIAQGLAEEWAVDGIRVNAVSPERTDTPMRRAAFPSESRVGMLQPRDVAIATLRLVLSDLSGQVLDVRRHDGFGAVVGPDTGIAGADTDDSPREQVEPRPGQGEAVRVRSEAARVRGKPARSGRASSDSDRPR
jgi:2-C-methyl-D-erythritol 4-phosphate cytidylyltransferase